MKKELTNRKIRHYEEVKPAEYRKEGKITRTEVEYWSDRRNTCFHHYDDVEFYPIEKEDLYQKWIETLSMFALGGEGDYFYTDEGLKKMYYELCEDIKKADEKFEQEIRKIYK
ncbi:hypothetical protein [Fusobacterium polymorphum]|uniref:hypothetical protein n=1 Tax=Fusobacterium nucleatum subsp. polymorphum TaxID=76857 RepID=UPI0030D530C4